MEDRKVILTVYEDNMGIDLEIDADGEQLIMIIKAISEAILDQAATEAH